MFVRNTRRCQSSYKALGKKKRNLCKITGVYEIMIGVAGRRQMMAINW